MDRFSGLLDSLVLALDPLVLLTIAVATTFGAIIGAIPGISSVMAISLLLPVVYPLDPLIGLLILGSIYMGAMYGDANSAILLNIPGTPSAVPTTFDGYPMTLQGRAREALLAALAGSVIGGAVGVLALLFSFGILAQVSLMFGPQEFFWLTVLGLTMIAALSSGNMLKGLLGGGIGICISLIGIDPYWGSPRFTFGERSLIAGVDLIPALLGLFCLAQVLESLRPAAAGAAPNLADDQGTALKLVLRNLRTRWDVLVRSSFIGVVIGILPGVGAPIASTVSYNETRRWDPRPERYGKGAVEGVVASEVASNAQVGGSLIPMMALGIPGNVNAAVILGALLSFGLRPGAQLLEGSGGLANAFIIGLLISSLMMGVLGYLFIIRVSTLVLRVPAAYLAPSILVFAVIGSYSVSNSIYGVAIMLAMGIAGFLLRRIGIDAAPVGLGLILGPIAEREFTSSILIAQASNDIGTLFLRPISLVLIVLCLASVASPLIGMVKKRISARQQGDVS